RSGSARAVAIGANTGGTSWSMWVAKVVMDREASTRNAVMAPLQTNSPIDRWTRETVRSVITENLVAHSIGTTFGPPSGMAKKLEPPLRHRHEAPPSSRSRREEAHFNFRLPIFDCRFSIADFRLPNAEGPGSWPQCASATRRSLLSMNLP